MYAAMAERGQSLPPEAAEPEPGTDQDITEWYLQAFRLLSTCRDYSFGAGPIPWIAIDRYSERHGLSDENHQVFEYVIYQMDGVYLKREATKAKAKEDKK